MEYSSALCLTFAIFTSATPIYEKSKCDCPMIYSPVCGTDNKDYDNSCLLTCAAAAEKIPSDLKINFYGPCNSNEQIVRSLLPRQEKKKLCSCPSDAVEPVCDSNGRTHTSDCHFKCHRSKGLKIVREGACDEANASSFMKNLY